MAHPAPAIAASAPAARGLRGLFSRIGAFLAALDGDHFATSEARIQRLEQRITHLEHAAAQQKG